MNNVDISSMVVGYNFVVGILVMLSSEKIGSYAGYISDKHRGRLTRLTRLSMFTFGACVASLSGSIYLLAHLWAPV